MRFSTTRVWGLRLQVWHNTFHLTHHTLSYRIGQECIPLSTQHILRLYSESLGQLLHSHSLLFPSLTPLLPVVFLFRSLLHTTSGRVGSVMRGITTLSPSPAVVTLSTEQNYNLTPSEYPRYFSVFMPWVTMTGLTRPCHAAHLLLATFQEGRL